MLSYLMKMEMQDEAAKREAEFKWTIFANDRELYFDMFEKERQEVEEGLDWIVPQSEEDVEEIMAMMEEAP